jgi:hypothetical protein
MSGNRIKYIDHKYKDNHVISLRSFVSSSTGANYRIVLNLENKQFFIRNERTKEFVKKSKEYGNMNVLKRNARKALESLGVELKRESRDRSFGRCEKGWSQSKEELKNNYSI